MLTPPITLIAMHFKINTLREYYKMQGFFSIGSKPTFFKSHFNFSFTSFIFQCKLIFFPKHSDKTRIYSVLKKRSKVTFMYKQSSSIISAAPAWDRFATCPCQILFKEKKKKKLMYENKEIQIFRGETWHLLH